MYRVRYYEKYFHPDQFNKGVLGRSIRTLNWMRWKLETFNQRLVLRYLCKEGAVDKQGKERLRERFSIDVEAERVQKRVMSPVMEGVTPFSVFSPTKEAPPELIMGQPLPVPPEHDAELPVRPMMLDDLIARYGGQPSRRVTRYARGRKFLVIEDAADPVPAPSEPSVDSPIRSDL